MSENEKANEREQGLLPKLHLQGPQNVELRNHTSFKATL